MLVGFFLFTLFLHCDGAQAEVMTFKIWTMHLVYFHSFSSTYPTLCLLWFILCLENILSFHIFALPLVWKAYLPWFPYTLFLFFQIGLYNRESWEILKQWSPPQAPRQNWGTELNNGVDFERLCILSVWRVLHQWNELWLLEFESWLWLASFVTFSVPQFHLQNEDVIMAATLEGYDNWMRSSLGKSFSKVLGTYQAFTNLI